MSMSNAAETALLELIFHNEDWANVGDAGGLQNSAAAGSLYVALHTADPGEAGDQQTSEATYTSYARVAVARSAAGWTITANVADNAAAVNFPAATGGTNHITHVSVGLASAGASQILWSGELTAHLDVSAGITPSFAIGALDCSID